VNIKVKMQGINKLRQIFVPKRKNVREEERKLQHSMRLQKHYSGRKVKAYVMDGACSTWCGNREVYTWFW
jgi:uncharacterized protein with von Willebrand factor type A (vWA) domain